MATLLDTSALVVFLRRGRPSAAHERLASAVGEELRSGQAVLSAVTVAELLVGASEPAGATVLLKLAERVPVIGSGRELAAQAGAMGSYLRGRGSMVPVVDLLIAATAVWLEVPLLTCDSDFARGRATAVEDGQPSVDRDSWRSLQIHPASVV